MSLFEILPIQNKKKWNDIVASFPDFDNYYLTEYASPFMYADKIESFLIHFKGAKMELCYVIDKSDIAENSNFERNLAKNIFFDISTPYGYGGPLVKNYNREDMECFFSALTKWAQNENIVSQFIRFHPLIENHKFFDGFSTLKTFKKTVFLDLTNDEILYKNMSSTCRWEVKKAIKKDVTICIDNSKSAQENFVKMYLETMNRNQASNYYYFNESFFDSIFSYLGENSNLFNAYYNNKIVSSAIILKGNDYLHYHLSASDKEYMNLSANRLLIYEVAKWGIERGYKKLHLGGGNDSEDSLFMYKRSFNKQGLKDFYIGSNIFDKVRYNELMELRKKLDPKFNIDNSFMIGYRA